MIVCHCRAVSHRVVDEVVAGGAVDVEAVTAACGAGGDCRGCHRRIEAALAAADRAAAAVGAVAA